MALIKCSECDKEISDKTTSCPNCGNPIKQFNTTPVMLGKLVKELAGDEIKAAKRIGKPLLSFGGWYLIIICALLGLLTIAQGIIMLTQGVEGISVLFMGIVFCAGAYYLWRHNKK